MFNDKAGENVSAIVSVRSDFQQLLFYRGGINMFIKNRAKISGKLAGNWRHLQNKRDDGEVVTWRVLKEELLGWPPPIYWWGRHLKRGDLVC